MKTKLFLLVSAILLINSTCKKDAEAPVLISSDIVIKPWEKLDSTQRTFELRCETEERYPCDNYSISNNIGRSENSIDISFGQIIKPEICATAFGSARAYLNLGSIIHWCIQYSNISTK